VTSKKRRRLCAPEPATPPGCRVQTRDTILEDISYECWYKLVLSAVDNPGLNIDESNQFGPDMLTWDIHKAMVTLLQTAPVEPNWVRVLHQLLLNVDPANVRTLDSEVAVYELLARWQPAKVPKMFEPSVEDDGYYSSNTLAEEFCGLMSALYGHVFIDKKFVNTGAPNSPDLVSRCAYYGQASMSPEQITAQSERTLERCSSDGSAGGSPKVALECKIGKTTGKDGSMSATSSQFPVQAAAHFKSIWAGIGDSQ